MCEQIKNWNKLLLISLSNVQNFIANARKAKDLYNGSMMVQQTIIWIQNTLMFDEKKCVKSKNCTKDTVNNPQEDMEVTFCLEDKIEETNVPNFLLYRFFYKGNKANREIEEFIYRKLLGNMNEEKIPVDLIPYIVVEDIKENNYEEAYYKIHRKLNAYKNNRLESRKFLKEREEEEAQKKEQQICSLCGIRYGKKCDGRKGKVRSNRVQVEEDDEVLCKECEEKREYTRIGFESVDDIAEIGKKDGIYYALIRADLDDMGKKIAKVDEAYREEGLLKWQVLLKKFLKDFSNKIEKMVQEIDKNHNLLVYAGGDDLLFFCPIDQVMNILQKIEGLLQESWKGIVVAEKGEIETTITMSKCVTIAHKKAPLKRVIQLSKNYLETTKKYRVNENDNEKDNIGFLLILNGYEQSFSVIKKYNLKYVNQLLEGIGKDFSRNLLYQLQERIRVFGMEVDSEQEVINTIICNDMKMLLKTKCRKEAIEKYKESFDVLYSQFTERCGKIMKINSKYFFELLYIIDKWAAELKEKGK